MSKDSRSNPHMQFSSPLAQHQGYMPYMHGYPYGQGYDPNHPGYRGMPSVMMQNYPGTYSQGLSESLFRPELSFTTVCASRIHAVTERNDHTLAAARCNNESVFKVKPKHGM